MATYYAPGVTTYGYQPAGSGHGLAGVTQHLHAVIYTGAALALNDVLEFGYLPPNAVVTGAVLKADGQLDTGGSPTLTLDMGVTGATAEFKSAISTVGRAAGATADSTLTGAGTLYKNTSGARLMVVGKVHAAAETAAATGTIECDVSYFVEDTPGSQA